MVKAVHKLRVPKLSGEQMRAVDTLLALEKPVQTLGGYAGTGKTTVIKELKKQLPEFAVCAFTGKAANVLRRKGVAATTIHSLIYKPIEKDSLLKDGQGKRRRELTWGLVDKDELPCSGFIVDEASMVTSRIHGDLLSFRLPIIFVGDHGQLEPVGDNFNLMRSPDVKLEKVHRNAGEIAHFAEFIRDGNDPCDWLDDPRCTGKAVRIRHFSEIDTLPDQFICRFNKTRVALNQVCRDLLDLPDGEPVVGDRIMCLRNDHYRGLFNGMQGEIAAIELKKTRLTFLSDGKTYEVKYAPEQFNCTEAPEYSREQVLRGIVPFDYCYAVTCHKAQGDEWNHVMVFEQHLKKLSPDSITRWNYTAASRAREQLTWIPPNWT